jgi:hypothetical protein
VWGGEGTRDDGTAWPGTPERRALRSREGAIWATSRGPRGGVGGDGVRGHNGTGNEGDERGCRLSLTSESDIMHSGFSIQVMRSSYVRNGLQNCFSMARSVCRACYTFKMKGHSDECSIVARIQIKHV